MAFHGSAAWLPMPGMPLPLPELLQEGDHGIGTGLLPFSSLPKDLSAAPAQPDPGLATTCSYKTSLYSVIQTKLNFQVHLTQNSKYSKI